MLERQLTEMHGGSVSVSSQGEGEGTTFTLLLPLSLAHTHGRAHEDERLAHAAMTYDADLDLAGVKVLVIDDEADSYDVARRILESCSAEVFTAGSVDEGLTLFKTNRPHVVVSDIGMPGKDGYQLIRAIRSLPSEQGGQTPAAALTAFARSEDRRRALLAGYQSHVVKPVEPAELITVVASLAGRTGRFSAGH